MTAFDPAMKRLLAVSFGVVAVDMSTKAVAIGTLASRDIDVGGPFFLGLLFNDALLAGLSTLGGWAIPLSILASLVLVALALPVCKPLSEYDTTAPIALGLMVGAAVANPASLALQPAGVTDFLGVHLAGGYSVLFNLADVAAYVGLALCGRTLARVVAAYRIERRAYRPRAMRRIPLEREVPLAVWRDSRRDAPEPIPVPATLIPLLADAAQATRHDTSYGDAMTEARLLPPE